jgi:hypothetical protein
VEAASDRKLSVSVSVSAEISVSVLVSFNLSVSTEISVQNWTENQKLFTYFHLLKSVKFLLDWKKNKIIFNKWKYLSIKHFLIKIDVGLSLKVLTCNFFVVSITTTKKVSCFSNKKFYWKGISVSVSVCSVFQFRFRFRYAPSFGFGFGIGSD